MLFRSRVVQDKPSDESATSRVVQDKPSDESASSREVRDKPSGKSATSREVQDKYASLVPSNPPQINSSSETRVTRSRASTTPMNPTEAPGNMPLTAFKANSNKGKDLLDKQKM